MIARVIAALALGLVAQRALAACDAEGHCEIPLGTYHISVPEGADNVPMVLWLHGYGGSGAGALRNAASIARYADRGYAFAAADGLARNGDGPTTWSFHPSIPQARDEAAFLAAVAEDIVAQFPIDRSRIVLAGFSIGGSQTSYLACSHPDLFDAYAPVAGAFWRPHPESCVGPVDLFHTHGWRDGTVPLEGRVLGGGTMAQGDVWQAMQIWRQANGCHGHVADEFAETEGYLIRRWTACDAGALAFALHPGGHGIPPGWSGMILDWYEALPAD